MAEKAYFYDSTADDERIYQAADWARFHAQIIGNGVSNTVSLPDLEVSAKSSMEVSLGAGYMFANGYMYENSSTMTLKHDIADNNNDRIDRIVIRFDSDPAERSIKAVIKKGTPGSSPSAPSVTRDSYVYEMSVAQVKIIAAKSHIEDGEITDERANDSVCGYIPLHNIYRGMQIDENGIVDMPNQSYVESDGSVDITISDRTWITLPIGEKIKKDHQNEVKDNAFYPVTQGVYYVFGYVAFSEGVLPDGADVQLSIRVNNDYSTVFVADVPGGRKDNIFSGGVVESIDAGDKVEIRLVIRSLTEDVKVRNIRARVAKIS